MAHCSFPGIKNFRTYFSIGFFPGASFLGYCLETNDLKVLGPALFGHQDLPQLRERNFVGWKAPLLLNKACSQRLLPMAVYVCCNCACNSSLLR